MTNGSATTLSVTTLSIMALGIMIKNATISITAQDTVMLSLLINVTNKPLREY